VRLGGSSVLPRGPKLPVGLMTAASSTMQLGAQTRNLTHLTERIVFDFIG
jgi:hypothetical protein